MIASPSAPPSGRRARIIVIGNEKGGSGKSTTAMHAIVGLLRAGHAVASMDVDSRQASLTRYLENRAATARSRGLDLPSPVHCLIGEGEDSGERFMAALEELSRASDAVVIDTPGSNTPLSRLAHSHADTLVTPINDSFVDLDLLARIDPDTLNVIGPSIYAEMVWEQRKLRMLRERVAVDWLVVRNRVSSTETRNKRNMEQVLEKLAKRIGFRIAPGFGDRVIFREMFLSGLTLLDMRDAGIKLSLSHVAARQEVRDLLAALTAPPTASAAAALRPGGAPAGT